MTTTSDTEAAGSRHDDRDQSADGLGETISAAATADLSAVGREQRTVQVGEPSRPPTVRRPQRPPGLAVQFFLLAALLLAVTLGVTILIASSEAQRAAEETIRADLELVPERLDEHFAARGQRLLEHLWSLAEEPGPKAIFGESVDTATRWEFATNDAPHMVPGVGTVFLFDRSSRLMARSDRPEGHGLGQVFAGVSWVAEVLDTRQGVVAFVREGRTLAQVVSVPVISGAGEATRLQGALAATFPLDLVELQQVRTISRGVVASVVDSARRGEPVRLELGPATSGSVGAALVQEWLGREQAMQRLISGGERLGPVELELDGAARFSLAIPMRNATGEVLGALVVSRSRSEEMAAFVTIRQAMVWSGIGMLLLSVPASFLLSRRLARPLRRLAGAAEAIRDGRLDVKPEPGARGEVGVLADAFASMVEELREKQALEDLVSALRARGTRPSRSGPGVGAIAEGLRLPAPGEIVGSRYRIEKELGRGGMAVVYRAFDLDLEEDIALKALAPHMVDHGGHAMVSLRHEVRLARRITHANVVRVHDMVEADGLHLLSMEYVPGVTLLDLLQDRGALELAPGLQVAKQLCRGLVAVHREGIVHRDLKPQNVMVLPGGVVKLMDFGISRHDRSAKDPDAGEGATIGTPRYMSPEQCRGGDVTQLSDIYSLGVVLWQMFTGTVPFESDTLAGLMRKHLVESPPSLRGIRAEVPISLEGLIMRCLAKDPSQRPGGAAEVSAGLRSVSDELLGQRIGAGEW